MFTRKDSCAVIGALALAGLLLVGCGGKARVRPAVDVTAEDVSALERQAREAPDDIDVRLKLVRAYLDADSTDRALQEAEAAASLDSTSQSAKTWLAIAQLHAGNDKDALESLVSILLAPNVPSDLVAIIGQEVGHPYHVERITDDPGNAAFPFPGPKGRKLAFQSDRDGNWEIYLLDLQGNGQRRLTDHPARDESPAFSPNGEVVAFTSTRNDSSETTQEELRRDILLLPVAGGSPFDLVVHPEDDWFPRFAPDGKSLYFVSERDDPRPIPPEKKRGEIYRMQLSDRSISRLTENEYDDASPWPSSDGKWLFFANNASGQFGVYALQLDSRTTHPVVQANSLGVEEVGAPSVAADGRTIALVGRVQKNYDLYLFDWRDGRSVRLTRHSAADQSPIIDRHGTRIYFHSNRGGRFQLYLLDLTQLVAAPELAQLLQEELNQESLGGLHRGELEPGERFIGG